MEKDLRLNEKPRKQQKFSPLNVFAIYGMVYTIRTFRILALICHSRITNDTHLVKDTFPNL